MTTAVSGARSWYVDDHADEHNPCETSLSGWAAYLAAIHLPTDQNPEPEDEPVADGAHFSGSAILWHDDIVATRDAAGAWTLSREPGEDDFVAVRWAEGMGWPADNIIYHDMHFDPVTKSYDRKGTLGDALRQFLTENSEICEDIEHVASGTHEQDYTLTFHRGDPSTMTAERKH